MKTFRLASVSLTEEVIEDGPLGGEVTASTRCWVAELDGPLSTGERVNMVRSGATADEAQSILLAAAKEQGWEPRA